MLITVSVSSGQRPEVNLRVGCLFGHVLTLGPSVTATAQQRPWVIPRLECQQARLSVATSTQESVGVPFPLTLHEDKR